MSTQHYAFSVQAFVNVIESCEGDEYEFVLRERATGEIIDDVRTFRARWACSTPTRSTGAVLFKAFDDADVAYFPLFDARVHVFVASTTRSPGHAAEARRLGRVPRYSFEQGTENSFYYSEEPLSYLPHKRNIRISDRGTLTNLLTSHNGYTLSTGVLSAEMHSGHRVHPLGRGRVDAGGLHHAQRAPPQSPAAALHLRTAGRHPREPHGGGLPRSAGVRGWRRPYASTLSVSSSRASWR